jgi:DNA replication protein DnaC
VKDYVRLRKVSQREMFVRLVHPPGDAQADFGEAKDEKRLLRFQKLLASYELLIIDELGFVPLSKTGAEMLFEIFSLRYERGATMVTRNLLCGAPHNRFNAESIFMRRGGR